MTTKYFKYAFAVSGDRAAVPNATQLDGTVSWESGFPVGYQLDYSDPDSLNIPRDQYNQATYDITLAIKQIQEHGYPEFITSAMNDGASFGYDEHACVWQPTDGNNYTSLIDNNTDVPPSVNWRLITFSSGIPVGSGFEYWGVTLPTGWLWQNGQTIGNASSNATGRANADTADLFAVLWALPTTTFQLYSSAGAPVTRGVNAAADFAANRAIALPDTRERVVAGTGTMGGTADPNRITVSGAGFSGVVVGAAGGAETVALTENQNGAHTHSGTTTNTGSAHTHTISEVADGEAGGPLPTGEYLEVTHNRGEVVPLTSPYPTTDTGQGSHTHTFTTGSSGLGSAHQNTQPTIICNKIIKL